MDKSLSLQKRIESALEEHGPNHVLAVKMDVGVSTINRILTGYIPKQRRVIRNINQFLTDNGY